MNNDVNEIDEGLISYFNNLKKFKTLTKKEEHKLLEAYKKRNDLNARNKLIESNLKYACKLANNYRGRGVSFDDLISEANNGLIDAIDKFDITQDVKLISYSKWWILQRMQAALERKNKMPEEALPQDYEFNDNYDDTFIDNDCIIDTDEKFIEDEFSTDSEDAKVLLNKILNVTSDRERDMISRYYGLNNLEKQNLDEIGEVYHLTKERVRQIIEKAFVKIRSEALLVDNVYV